MKTMSVSATSLVWTTVLLTLPLAATAQEPRVEDALRWNLTLIGEGGVFYSTRDLGKATIAKPDGQAAQMRTEPQVSPTAALGVEIQSPWEALRIRVMGRTTVGGGASGQLAGCEVVTAEEAQGECVEVDTDGSVRTVTAGLMFIRRESEQQRFRPYLTLDAGLRFFSFDDQTCGLDAVGGQTSFTDALCSGQNIIAEDQTRAVLHVGLGIRADFGRASGYVHAVDSFGQYEVSGEAEGETQNALLFTAGIAWPLGS